MSGPLLLVGGAEWQEGCTFDAEAFEAAGRPEVLVLPTAAAYEHPERAVATATAWFAGFGAKAVGLEVLKRPDAEREDLAAQVAAARFIYLGGGSPLHLRSVLKDSAVWRALVSAWEGGATVAGSSAGAMALTDPMVDPRGGAFTLGLGLIAPLAVVPHYSGWSEDKTRRTMELAPKNVPILAVDERTAAIRDPDGTWRATGVGRVQVFLNGAETPLSEVRVG
ncbi:MAG TPA: Type 1 glutamine amidotransferase-like domain-containing protein [Acidimicrobiales bacterium]|nr:Type 1 glutamine amidotransferase-like domain-containing protein [Acidimicrobiales bacterium]